MASLLDLFVPTERLITEHGSAAILREHVALLKQRVDLLSKDNERLQKELSDLKTECDTASHTLKEQTILAQFTEHRGVLFRRLADGKVEDEVYCPTCRLTMSSPALSVQFICSKCKFRTSFAKRDLRHILNDVP